MLITYPLLFYTFDVFEDESFYWYLLWYKSYLFIVNSDKIYQKRNSLKIKILFFK